MKNIILSLLLLLTVSACSSGSSIADDPFNITGLFEGVYEINASPTSTDVRNTGLFTLNIVEAPESGLLSGNILFRNGLNAVNNGCIFNGQISGATSGFTASLTISVPDGTTDDNGDTVSGSITYQLTQSNNGNTLTGTYTSNGLTSCSNFSGSGTVDINR